MIFVISRHPNISLITKVKAPTVFHKPVVFPIKSPIANHENTMIHILGTGGVIIDTTLVEEEGGMAGVDAHRDRPFSGHCFFQSFFIAEGELNVP